MKLTFRWLALALATLACAAGPAAAQPYPAKPIKVIVPYPPGGGTDVVDSWYGVLAPAKMPPAIIARLNAALTKVLENPQIKERLFAQGAEAAPSTPAEFDRVIKDELAKWEYVIRAANIKPA